MMLANVLAISAVRHLGGSAVPGDLEDLVSFARLAPHPPFLRALVSALQRLPAPRVHAWFDRIIDTDGAAMAALGAHFDEARLVEALHGFAPIVVAALSSVGPPALPALLEAMNALPAERAAPVRHAFVFVLAHHVAEGATPPEELDTELLVAAFDGRPIERLRYGHALREATERIVMAMPPERRKAVLEAAYEAAPMSMVPMLQALTDQAELDMYLGKAVVDGLVTSWILSGLGARALPALLAYGSQSTRAAWVRQEAKIGLDREDFATVANVFQGGEKWRAIEKDVAAAHALDQTAPRLRVYLLEPSNTATPAREGSRSRLGGEVHGLRPGQIPKDDDGDELTHILTLDLEDVPELRARYPRASAIALFTPRPEEGEFAEDSVVVPLPLSAARTRPRGGGEPLAVLGIDVPPEVFGDGHSLAPELHAVRDRLLHASGHVFGRPFWIHDKAADTDGEGFVMQINQQLVDELNLGDGALYIYEDAVIAQPM